jgi:hypothetical protein
MNGIYNCQSPRLYSLNWTCKKLVKSLDFSITRIPRKENVEANHLANHAARMFSAKSRKKKSGRT